LRLLAYFYTMISFRSIAGLLSFIVPVFLFFYGCSKKQISEPPLISIISPPVGTSYQVYDTLLLTADFIDDQHLKSIGISLNDRNNQPVLPPMSIENPGNPYSLNAYYPITNSNLESGTYELQFQANDGEAITNVYRKIEISALPREFISPVIVTQNSSKLVTAYALDSTSHWKEVTRLWGDYLESEINSPFQQLYLSGQSLSDLQSWDMIENRMAWTIPAVQLPHGRWFESITYQYPYLLVSYFEGYVKGFDRWGLADFTIQVPGQFYPGKCQTLGDYIVIALYGRHSDDCSLGTFYFPGGYFRHLTPNVPPPVGMYPLDGHTLLLFGNDNNKIVINLYDLETEYFITLKEIANDSIYDVTSIDRENFFISGKSQIYNYSYTQNSLVEFVKGFDSARLAYETIDQTLYAASGKIIRRFSFPEGLMIDEIECPAEVVGINLLYNK